MNKNMFASDNYSSVCPEVWSAMEQANSGYANPTEMISGRKRLVMRCVTFFETDCQVFFCF